MSTPTDRLEADLIATIKDQHAGYLSHRDGDSYITIDGLLDLRGVAEALEAHGWTNAKETDR